MYIRLEGEDHILVRTFQGEDGLPQEKILASLGPDPELNLFFAAEQGRRKHPDDWEGIHDYHLLQALETFKRRMGNFKPALVAFEGKLRREEDSSESE